MDLMAVRTVLGEAIDRARKEKRPTLLEAETYRYRGHSMSDPGKYRTKEEVEQMMQFDPDPPLRQAADRAGAGRRHAELEAIDKDVLAAGGGRGQVRRGEPLPRRGGAVRGRVRALALHQHEGGREGPRLAGRR